MGDGPMLNSQIYQHCKDGKLVDWLTPKWWEPHGHEDVLCYLLSAHPDCSVENLRRILTFQTVKTTTKDSPDLIEAVYKNEWQVELSTSKDQIDVSLLHVALIYDMYLKDHPEKGSNPIIERFDMGAYDNSNLRCPVGVMMGQQQDHYIWREKKLMRPYCASCGNPKYVFMASMPSEDFKKQFPNPEAKAEYLNTAFQTYLTSKDGSSDEQEALRKLNSAGYVRYFEPKH